MKVLLLQLPQSLDYEYNFMFPLGIGYIASALENVGHDVKVIDLQTDKKLFFNITKIIKPYDFDIIGISGMISSYYLLKQLVPILKKEFPQIPIILGGHISSGIEKLFFEKIDIDFICDGEGEITIVDLLKAIENKSDLSKVLGIYFKDCENKLIFTGERPLISDLDKINFPAWHLFDIKKYFHLKDTKNTKTIIADKPMMGLLATRGCPGRCTFCSVGLGSLIRYRSPKNIVEEIKLLVQNYKIEEITFVDNTMTVNEEWLRELCKLIINANLNIKWITSSMLKNNIKDESTYDLMKKAGCFLVSYGLESGSKIILSSYKKTQNPLLAVKSFQSLIKKEISTVYQLIIGDFNETEETIRETTKLCFINAFRGSYYYLTPYPKTELYEKAKSENFIKDEDAYLAKISQGSVNLSIKPFINLTKMPSEKLIKLKEESEKDMNIFNEIRTKLGIFGENIFYPVIFIKDPNLLLNDIDNILESLKKHLENIKYIKNKYPELLLDINYYSSEYLINYSNVGVFNPNTEITKEKLLEMINYLILKYGIFAEKLLETILKLPKNEMISIFVQNFTNLKKIVHHDMTIINLIKEKLDTELIFFDFNDNTFDIKKI